jgi:hypothetical protein
MWTGNARHSLSKETVAGKLTNRSSVEMNGLHRSIAQLARMTPLLAGLAGHVHLPARLVLASEIDGGVI